MECIIRFNLKIHLIIKLSKVYITYVYLSINRSIVHHLISVYIDYKIVKNSLDYITKQLLYAVDHINITIKICELEKTKDYTIVLLKYIYMWDVENKTILKGFSFYHR